MDFTLTRKVNCFPTLIFFIYGANLNMFMLVKRFLILTILRLFQINMSHTKGLYYSQKLIFLCSGKLDQSKYPQKLMLKCVNSMAKIREN